MKTILVVGATGQTGKLVVEKSLANDHKVRVIVRSRNRLPSEILEHPNITLVEANVLDLMDEQMADLVKECDAIVSCLGHVISFQGIFGEPKLLCTEATKRLCKVGDWIQLSNFASQIYFDECGRCFQPWSPWAERMVWAICSNTLTLAYPSPQG